MKPRVSVEQVDPAATRWLRRQVLRPHQDIADLAAQDDVAGLFAIGAFEERQLLSCALAQPETCAALDASGAAWRIRGMATVPERRGEGFGRAVLDRLLDEIVLRGGDVVWANARTPAQGLYAAAGFAVEGEPWVDPEIGPHVVMWRMLR